MYTSTPAHHQGPHARACFYAGRGRRLHVHVAGNSTVSGGAVTSSVQPARQLSQLQDVARLRAEAYYENDRSRFVESLKRTFVGQEVESLQTRTGLFNPHATQLAECLVALEEDGSGRVVGCIDIRLPRCRTGIHPTGVPAGDDTGCYILNVVVREDRRSQGIGKQLMREAMHRACSVWGADACYTHVEADNEVAYRLYTGCGFRDFSVDALISSETAKLGKLVLLKATREQDA